GRRDRDVRGDQRHVCTAPLRLAGELDSHAPGRAVADEAHSVERLAGSTCRHEHLLSAQMPLRAMSWDLVPGHGWLEQLLRPLEDLLRLGHPPHAELALCRLALLRPAQLVPPP